MRRLRRFTAALMGVLVLQLSLLGAAAACSAMSFGAAAELAREAADNGTARGDAAHAHHEPGPTDAPDDASRSRHHDGQIHCPAATACTTVGVAAGSVALPEAASLIAGRTVAVNALAPASITGAPEPPPPRA